MPTSCLSLFLGVVVQPSHQLHNVQPFGCSHSYDLLPQGDSGHITMGGCLTGPDRTLYLLVRNWCAVVIPKTVIKNHTHGV
jgi:hypothetical protein